MKNNAKLLDWSIYITIVFIPITILLYFFQDYCFIDYMYSLSMNTLAGGIIAIITSYVTFKRNVITKRDDIILVLNDLINRIGSIHFWGRYEIPDSKMIRKWYSLNYPNWNEIIKAEQKEIINNELESEENRRYEELLKSIDSYNKILNFDLNTFLRMIEDIYFPFYERNKINVAREKLIDLYNSIVLIKNEEFQLKSDFEKNDVNMEIRMELVSNIEKNIFDIYVYDDDKFDRKSIDNHRVYGELGTIGTNKTIIYYNKLFELLEESRKMVNETFK